MDWKKIGSALGLSGDFSEEDVLIKLTERNRAPVGPSGGTGRLVPDQQTGGIDTSALSGDARTLAESFNAQFASLSEKIQTNQRNALLGNLMTQQFNQLSELLEGSQAQVRTAQATALSEKLTNTAGKKFALPATIQDKLRTQLLSDSPDNVPLNDVVAMFSELTEKGLVPLNEQTTGNPQAGEEQQPAAQGATTSDPQGEFLKFAEQLQKDNPQLSDTDAFEQAAVEHADLYNKAYRNAAFIEGAVR